MSTGANKQNLFQYKLVLLGESAVGKSSIASWLVKGKFDELQESTIGAAFFTHTLLFDEYTVKFEIWDTAGQERYHSLAPMYYRGAQAAVVVYDITKQESFDRAISWVKELQKQANTSIVIALVGNKVDLESEQRVVSKATGQEAAQKLGLLFFESSAKTGHNVNDLFKEIAIKLPKTVPLNEMLFRSGGSLGGSVNLRNSTGSTSERALSRCC